MPRRSRRAAIEAAQANRRTTTMISTAPEPELPSHIVPKMQNIVATVDFNCRLDLRTIAQYARNAEYRPKRFAAAIVRIREPKTTALVFSSGKLVITGARSEDESRLAGRKFARIVQKLGFKAELTEFKIQNMVGSVDVRRMIRLEGLAAEHRHFATYEPELFPGLIYRMQCPAVVLLIFVSGKIVITGAKSREEIQRALALMYPTIEKYGKAKEVEVEPVGGS